MAKPIGASRVTVRYQITVPRRVRDHLQLEVGDILLFLEEAGRIYLAMYVELAGRPGPSPAPR